MIIVYLSGDVSIIRAGSRLCIGCRKNSFLMDTVGSICKCATAIYDHDFRERAVFGNVNSSLHPFYMLRMVTRPGAVPEMEELNFAVLLKNFTLN